MAFSENCIISTNRNRIQIANTQANFIEYTYYKYNGDIVENETLERQNLRICKFSNLFLYFYWHFSSWKIRIALQNTVYFW